MRPAGITSLQPARIGYLAEFARIP